MSNLLLSKYKQPPGLILGVFVYLRPFSAVFLGTIIMDNSLLQPSER